MKLARFRVSKFLIPFGIWFSTSSFAQADRAIEPLSIVMSEAEIVAIGTVVEVVDGKQRGTYDVVVELEDVLRGPALSAVTLHGNDLHVEGIPRLPAGTSLALLLTSKGRANAQDGQFDVLRGDQGAMVLNENSRDPARQLLKLGVASGGPASLGDVVDLLRAEVLIPPALRASLLEDLTQSSTPKDALEVSELACDAAGEFAPAARLWAISRVGALRLADARECLEKSMRESSNASVAIASTEALGALGDPASLPALLRLLRTVPRDQRLIPRDRRGDTLTGPGAEDDPEDESAPLPDDDEDARQPGDDEEGGQLPNNPDDDPNGGDGQTEPEGKQQGDRARRRADGGLSVSAVHALGVIGDPRAISTLARIAFEGDDLALHSSVVSSLGMIGGTKAMRALRSIERRHSNPLIREQASEALEGLKSQPQGRR